MEDMVKFGGQFVGRRVWLSGHTGFKGSWLSEWLLALGAEVTGFALSPPTEPALFDQLGLAERMRHEVGDVRNREAVADSIITCQPDFVFHLAAQPLVRLSYAEPVETYTTNVMGTVHVLDALRRLENRCGAVFVTTDKCYENREWVHGYREEDPMGGYDPYSSSKGMAELAISAYRRSFFPEHPVQIASARAGNVIGGGDWALDRIVPDCVRALRNGEKICVRDPRATRPWQHVLDPLSGYLCLAAQLYLSPRPELGGGFNFGPGHDANRNVEALVREILKSWSGDWFDQSGQRGLHEARSLQLSTDKAHALLGWSPVWNFTDAVRETICWYRDTLNGVSPAQHRNLTCRQIESYVSRAQDNQASWIS